MPSARSGAPTYVVRVRSVSSSTAVARVRNTSRTPEGCDSALRQHLVGDLGAGAGRQPVGEQAALGALQLQGAADQVGGDRRRLHGSSLTQRVVRRSGGARG